MNFSKYERKAEDILEKLQHEEPNERNFKVLSEALVVMAGAEIAEMMEMKGMGMSQDRYDGGRRDEYYRGRSRRTGRYVSRYDGGMEDEYRGGRSGGRYDGGMRYDGQSGRYDGQRQDQEYEREMMGERYDGRGR